MEPCDAVDRYGEYLSKAERWEILDLDEVYYVGQNVETPSVRLMQPPVGSRNGGWDDKEGYMVVIPHDHIGYRYEVIRQLGMGACAQVVKVWDHKEKCPRAIKIIRNIPIFRHLADQEIEITQMLSASPSLHSRSKQPSPGPKSIVQIIDHFTFREHPCLVFELLSSDLQTFMETSHFQGFDVEEIKQVAQDILHGLEVLHHSKVVHSDLKPANVMFEYPNPPRCRCKGLFRHTSSAKLICDDARTCGLPETESAAFLCAYQKAFKADTPESSGMNWSAAADRKVHLDSGFGSATLEPPSSIDQVGFSDSPSSVENMNNHLSSTTSSNDCRFTLGEPSKMDTGGVDGSRPSIIGNNSSGDIKGNYARKYSQPNTEAARQIENTSKGELHHYNVEDGNLATGNGGVGSGVRLRCKSGSPSNVRGRRSKLIDFGCSTKAQFCRYLYVQSRFYRAPEVILGSSYGCPIDMWSFGCILAELVIGRPLLAGETEEDQLALIIELCGVPPKEVLASATKSEYYVPQGVPRYCRGSSSNSSGAGDVDSMEVNIEVTCPSPITGAPRGLPGSRTWQSILQSSRDARRSPPQHRIRYDPLLVDLLNGCLQWVPSKRLTPTQALAHPWFSAESNPAGDPGDDVLDIADYGGCRRLTM